MADNKFDRRTRAMRRLAALPAAMKAAVAAQLKVSANQLAADIRAAAPVDDGVLRESVRTRDISEEARIAQQVSAGDDGAFYARFQEFGTPTAPAQPFFFPVYRANRRRIRSQIGRAIGKAARAAVSKG